MDDFADALLMVKAGHPELAGWWGKLLGGASGGGGSGGGGGGSDDDGGSKPFDQLTWDQVIASTKTGKYKTFTVGDMKELDLGSEGVVHLQIVGIDVDDLADGSGKAPLTFISHELLETSRRMNPANSGNTEGTGTIGGWEKCEMRTYLKENVKPLIPTNVRSAIQNVTKYSRIYNTSGAKVSNSATTDDVWIPSDQEIFGGTSYETLGHVYSDVFTDSNSRIKRVIGRDYNGYWWLRSANNVSRFRYVGNDGTPGNLEAERDRNIALGFCL